VENKQENNPISLFDTEEIKKQESKSRKIDSTIDQLKNKFGNKIINPLISGVSKSWRPKADYKSNNYTTNWNELLEI
jgi:hypothetical protein